ncbi:muramoyltetrapeptide carboxypeptidase [Stackebrandtia endophytica]|uniref:Muramoyltetrapeptide carboxypeptidase n=1 Tax=Stackebrandtia endophytica TaxID=1496996 RepID=A0A543ARG5_9ACTN|nr:LD-carboxypeptidase [Stackebrandtia endophytica]TQL75164.1 muramoyltetrapeptide carboxypeptidase [Stackebrandtia endophytica]
MTLDLIRPPALAPGDTVRVVAPSGPVDPAKAAPGLALLESWGLAVQVSDRIYRRWGYLAGEDRDRAKELNDALADPEVAGIFCARGGYGVSRIIDDIDFGAARANPKVVVGYSDITVLHQGLYVHAGVAAVHGPVVTTFQFDHDGQTAVAWRNAVMSTDPIVIRRDPAETTAAVASGEPVAGPLLGGNLSLVVDAVGTPTCPDYTGAIVFLEEVHEEPYRIDRMLTQLLRSGAFDQVAGFALGQYTDCDDTGWGVDVTQVLRDRLGELGVPMLGGLRLGHGDNPLAIPFGTPARLDPEAGTLTATAAVG